MLRLMMESREWLTVISHVVASSLYKWPQVPVYKLIHWIIIKPVGRFCRWPVAFRSEGDMDTWQKCQMAGICPGWTPTHVIKLDLDPIGAMAETQMNYN